MSTIRIGVIGRIVAKACLGFLLTTGSFGVGGCSTERASSAARSPSGEGESAFFPNSLSSDAAPTGTPVPFAGGAVAGAQPESRELVTVVGLVRPRLLLPGLRRHRYAVVELSIRNVGSVIYADSPGQEVSLVSSTTGGYVGHVTRPPVRVRGCRRDLSRPVQLAPGGRLDGCVFFLLPPGQRVTAVQYHTQGGEGPNAATWALSRWQIHG